MVGNQAYQLFKDQNFNVSLYKQTKVQTKISTHFKQRLNNDGLNHFSRFFISGQSLPNGFRIELFYWAQYLTFAKELALRAIILRIDSGSVTIY